MIYFLFFIILVSIILVLMILAKKNKITGSGNPKLEITYSGIPAQGPLEINQTKTEPKVKIFNLIQPGQLFTFIMLDRNNPQPNFVHWLIINNSNGLDGNLILSYYPPDPPKNTGIHNYTFYVLRQSKKIIPFNWNSGRTNFNFPEFLKKWGLKKIISSGFYINSTLV